MTYMLARLYDLPDIAPLIEEQRSRGIDIRRALATDMHKVKGFIRQEFDADGWVDECEVTFSNQPISCFVAVKNNEIIGFSCYDTTAKNFGGPTGISEKYRGHGVGKALVLAKFRAMVEMGYLYAIIPGGSHLTGFFSKVVNAVEIEGVGYDIYK